MTHHHLESGTLVEGLGPGIRAPLGVVREFAGILHEGLAGPTTAEQRQYLRIMEQRIDQIERFVRNLEIGREMKAGTLCITRRVCRWQQVLGLVLPSLSRRGIDVNPANYPTDTLPNIFCDPERIAHGILCILFHLLDHYPDQIRIRPSPAFLDDDHRLRMDLFVFQAGPQEIKRLQDALTHPGSPHRVAPDLLSTGHDLHPALELLDMNLCRLLSTPLSSDACRGSVVLPLAQPASLFPEYFKRFVNLRGERSHVSIIEVSADGPPDMAGNLGAFIQQQIRRFDLAYPLDDGRWLIVAPTPKADAGPLVRRLEQHWRSTAPATIAANSLLRILHRGTWSVNEVETILRNLYMMTA